MKKIIISVISIILCMSLFSSCSFSSYSAVMMLKTENSNGFELSFGSLSGELYEDVKNRTGRDSAFLCKAELGEGELTVYYKDRYSDVKSKLFTVKGGEVIDGEFGYIGQGNSGRIYIEANGKCKDGMISVEIIK